MIGTQNPLPGGTIVPELADLTKRINEAFTSAFGPTPLRERLDDIMEQALSVKRYHDVRHLRDEAGDLLCSLLQLFNECDWSPTQQIDATLAKIQSRKQQYAALGRRISVAVFGGAFNPIHNGHIQTARLVLDASKMFDEVWLMPAFGHTHKQLSSPEHRLEMCRLAAQADPRIKVFDYEIQHQLSGETYHFVKRLLAEPMAHERYVFSVIIGQDNANAIDTWVNGEESINLIRYVVVPRAGVPADLSQTWYLRPPHVYLVNDQPQIEVSSTLVRRLLRERSPAVTQLLDASVLKYITNRGLYAEG